MVSDSLSVVWQTAAVENMGNFCFLSFFFFLNALFPLCNPTPNINYIPLVSSFSGIKVVIAYCNHPNYQQLFNDAFTETNSNPAPMLA